MNVLAGSPPDYGERLDALVDAVETPAEKTKAVYLDFLERFGPNFAAAIRAIADAPPGGVVVHCQGGKDRTGLVVALLLSLAGVSREEIAADYALSERNLVDRQSQWEAERRDRRRARAPPPDRPHAARGDGRRARRARRALRRRPRVPARAGATDDELDRAVARCAKAAPHFVQNTDVPRSRARVSESPARGSSSRPRAAPSTANLFGPYCS